MCFCFLFNIRQLRGLLVNNFHLQCRQIKTNIIQLCIPLVCYIFVALLQVMFNYVVKDLNLDAEIVQHKQQPFYPYNWIYASEVAGVKLNLSVPHQLMYSMEPNHFADVQLSDIMTSQNDLFWIDGKTGDQHVYVTPTLKRMPSWKNTDETLLAAIKGSKENRDMAYLGSFDVNAWGESYVRYTLQYDFTDPRIKLDLRSKLFNAAVNSVTGFCLDIELYANTRGCSQVVMAGITDSITHNFTKTLTGGKHIDSFVQQMPFNQKKFSVHMNLKEILDVLFFPLMLNLMLPVFLYKLVLEKKDKLKEMMRLMGVRYYNYVISNVIFMIVFYMISVIVLVFLGWLWGYRVITQTHPVILLTIFIGSCSAVIGLSHLMAAIFRDQLIATVVGYFWVLFLPVVGFVLDNYVLKDGIWKFKPLLAILTLPISDSIFRIAEGCGNMNCPTDIRQIYRNKDLMIALIFLYVDAMIYFIVGIYLDLVLPQEWGKRKSPLFCFDICLSPISNFICKRRVYFGELDPDEDEDVKKLRDQIMNNELTKDNRSVLIRGLTKTFGKNVAVNRVCFDLKKNEIFGLLGPNGAGKTTTIRCLVGLIDQSSGEAFVGGHSIYNEMEAIRRSLGYCPQFDIQWEELTPREHLLFYSRIKGVSMCEEGAQVNRILRSIGLNESDNRGFCWHLVNFFWGLEKPVKELSGGMKRRLSIGISLCGNPKVVFLDEPTTGLDPSSKRQIWNIILKEKKNKSILITTHSMEEADVLSNTIGIMSKGNLVCCGSSLHLKSKYGTGYTLGINSADHEHSIPYVENLIKEDCKCKITSRFGEQLNWELSPIQENEIIRVSSIFEKLHTKQEDALVSDWHLNQTTLEDVFLNVIKKARDEEIAKEREMSKVDKKNKKNGDFGETEALLAKDDADLDDEEFLKKKILEDDDEQQQQFSYQSIENNNNNNINNEHEIVIEQQPVIIGEDIQKEEGYESEEPIIIGDAEEAAPEIYEPRNSINRGSFTSEFKNMRKRRNIQTKDGYDDDEEDEEDYDDPSDDKCVLCMGFQCCGTCILEIFLHTWYLLKKDICLTCRDCITSFGIMFSPIIPIFVIFLLSKIVVQDSVIPHPEPLDFPFQKCWSWGTKSCYSLTFSTNGDELGESVMKSFVDIEGLVEGKDYRVFEKCEHMTNWMEHNLNVSQNGVCWNNSKYIQMADFFWENPQDPDVIQYTIYYNSTTEDFNVGDSYDNTRYIKQLIDNLIIYHIRTEKNKTKEEKLRDLETKTSFFNLKYADYDEENGIFGDHARHGRVTKPKYYNKFIDYDFKPFPHIPASTNGQNVIFSAAGPNLISLSSMLLLIVVIQKLVVEKEKGLKQAMVVVGMRRIPYYCSFFIVFSCFAAVMSVVVVIAGCVFVIYPFIYCNQLILIFLFFSFDITLVCGAFFLSTFINSRRTGIIAGFVIFSVCCILNSFLSNGNDIYMFMDKRTPAWVSLFFEFLYPTWNFGKALSDIIHKTVKIYNPVSRKWDNNEGFGFPDLFKENIYDYSFGIVFNTQPTVYSFLFLMFNSLCYITGFIVITWIQTMYQSGWTIGYFIDLFGKCCYYGCGWFLCFDEKLKKLKEDKRQDFIDKLDEDIRNEFFLAHDEEDPSHILRVQELGKNFHKFGGRKTKAVKNVSFALPDRCCVSVLGHNGAGKSTTINLMTGYYSLSRGDIKLGSGKKNIKSVRKNLGYIRKNIGVCHQEDVLFPDLTAKEHLQLFAEIQGKMGCREISREIEFRLKQVSLWGVRNDRVKTFSGGMKRRLSVAISCIGNPNVVLLDEPTTGMDPYSRSQVWELIMKLKKEKVIFLTTHSMEEADALSDKIGIMTEGELKCIGNSLHLKQKYGSCYILKITVAENGREKLLGLIKDFFDSELNVVDEKNGIFRARVYPQWFDRLSLFLKVLEDEVDLNSKQKKQKKQKDSKKRDFENDDEEIEVEEEEEIEEFGEEMKGCVKNFGLTHTSLEDVYVKVTNLREFDNIKLEEDEFDEEVIDFKKIKLMEKQRQEYEESQKNDFGENQEEEDEEIDAMNDMYGDLD